MKRTWPPKRTTRNQTASVTKQPEGDPKRTQGRDPADERSESLTSTVTSIPDQTKDPRNGGKQAHFRQKSNQISTLKHRRWWATKHKGAVFATPNHEIKRTKLRAPQLVSVPLAPSIRNRPSDTVRAASPVQAGKSFQFRVNSRHLVTRNLLDPVFCARNLFQHPSQSINLPRSRITFQSYENG